MSFHYDCKKLSIHGTHVRLVWRPCDPNAIITLVPLKVCPEDVTVFAAPDKPCHGVGLLGLPKLVVDVTSVQVDIKGGGYFAIPQNI